jgi:hypothetical protein
MNEGVQGPRETHWLSSTAEPILNLEERLRAFTTDATSELNVLGHDGDTLGMNGAEVGVFEQSNQVSFASLLESEDGGRLEAQVVLEVLSNFSDETLREVKGNNW